MKLPFTLDSRLVMRILAPGFVLALGFFPVSREIAKMLGSPSGFATLLPTTSLLFGWLIHMLGDPIYMFFEGRRYWPKLCATKGIAEQQAHVKKWLDAGDIESKIKAYRYPIGGGRAHDNSGIPEATMPTELGNVIYGYETYPEAKYGVDGVFYWHRIWRILPNEDRKDIDEQQAMCDGAVYTLAALTLNFLLVIIYGALHCIASEGSVFASMALSLPQALTCLIALLLLIGLFRQAAITMATQFGDTIRAMYDTFLPKIDVDLAIESAKHRLGDKAPGFHGYGMFERHEAKLAAAWRYLRWHKARSLKDEKNFLVGNQASPDD